MTWCRQRERGSAAALRLMGWITLRLGWGVGHALLFPITAYFLISAPRQRAASRRYLRRALGREPGWRDLWGQFFAFAATILDRVFFLGGRTAGYDIRVHGLDALEERVAAGQGCILLGAHLGSFEAMRVLADRGCPVEVVALMHAENAARVSAFFAALGPRQAAAVIPLGQPDAMLRAKECLERGGLVGILADRSPDPGSDKVARVPFLGAPAAFPLGPHVLAAVLGAPVMLSFGLWRGPRRYEVRFEPFAERIVLDRRDRQNSLAASAARFAARLEEVVRAHPRNWFNFFDFWEEEAPAAAAAPRAPLRRAALRAGVAAGLFWRLRVRTAAAQPVGPLAAPGTAPGAAGAAAGTTEAAPGLDAVMRALAAVRGSQASFAEEKALPGLFLPLPSSGTLSWTTPDRLEKHTLEPVEEILRVEGERLLFERPGLGIRRELSLDGSPELRPLVEAVRSTLAGDLATLRRFYRVAFSGDPAGWEMRLTPLSPRVQEAVRQVTVSGRGGAVLLVESEGADGTTRLRITPRP
ncbi:LolA-related protein [Roseomonas sp. BN140053]|uniref:LpxL/LpxP family acyltransferase n=1 Tax=Roseomonas sp. BN140053 TaxID=3391898 RepID=UPI0039ECE8E2